MNHRRHALLLLPLALGACAGDVRFPSLAPRPVEGLLGSAPVETTTAAVTDPALEATVAEQVRRADAGARSFADALATARTASARPGTTKAGTEAWLSAQQALTDLGTAREAVAGALAELDAARLATGAQDRAVDTTRLDAALTRLTAIAAEQDAAYGEIAARLPNG